MSPGTPPASRTPAQGRPADNAQFLRKQRAAAEAIGADNQKLKEELMLENKFSVNPTTQTAAALIANLQEQADVYAAKARHLSGVALGKCPKFLPACNCFSHTVLEGHAPANPQEPADAPY